MIESVVAALKKCDSDVFCTKIEVPYEGLSLKVDPVGSVAFPLSARSAKALMLEAELAKFGKKTQTILDRNVRDVWEISKDRITLSKKWEKMLASVCLTVQANLGLPEEGTLQAELHNMLIYMPGQFFKGHQDSEKMDGMLATLVVLLPSDFSGGDLIIEQHGDKKKFSAPKNMDEKLTIIAFYADCHHEVTEVKKGYRVALTYNLIFKSSSKGLKPQVNEKLKKNLQAYFRSPPSEPTYSYHSKHPHWFVYLLDHEYTQKSLSWSMLRGMDRIRVAEFLGCADSLGLEAHLVLADIHESWSAQENDSYKRGWYNRKNRASHSDGYELIELLDEDIELRHWVSRADVRVNKKADSVPIEMVCWTKAVDEFQPFESDYEGYTGNAGNTLDRWYHRAALVLWQKGFEFANLFASNPTAALKKIIKLLKKDLKKGRAALQQIMPQWLSDCNHHVNNDDVKAADIFEVAFLVQDAQVASQFIKCLDIGSLSSSSISFFAKLLDAYGENWCLEVLQAWEKKSHWYFSELSMKNVVTVVKGLSEKYQKTRVWFLDYCVSNWLKEDCEEEKEYFLDFDGKSTEKRIEGMGFLLKAAIEAQEPSIHSRLLKHVLSYPRLYPPVECAPFFPLFDTLDAKALKDWGCESFLRQCKAQLEEDLLFQRAQNDWSIHVKRFHDCDDCQHLKKFILSATDQKCIWPLSKDRRHHIHSMIDLMNLPVTHETLREGSPQKLVLTKTFALFEREKAHAKKAAVVLEQLKKRI